MTRHHRSAPRLNQSRPAIVLLVGAATFVLAACGNTRSSSKAESAIAAREVATSAPGGCSATATSLTPPSWVAPTVAAAASTGSSQRAN